MPKSSSTVRPCLPGTVPGTAPGTVVLVIAIAVVLSACSQVRKVTYPSEFVYIDEGSALSIMHEMARTMERLDALTDSESVSAVDHERILEELNTLELRATSLQSNRSFSQEARDHNSLPATNHLVFEDYAGDFLELVTRAQRLARNEPPSYYGVGQVTGGCVACHRMR